MRLKLGLLSLFLIPLTLSATTAYKWTDAQGNVQYSQTPPPNDNATVITTPTTSQEAATKANQQLQKMEETFKKNQAEALAEEKKAEETEQAAQIKASNCEKAKTVLWDLSNKSRFSVPQPDGEVKWLTPEEIEAEKVKAQQAIAEYCH